MAEDAITDEVCDLHAFAEAAGPYEAMVRVFTDTGMRLGEVLPLRRERSAAFSIRWLPTADTKVGWTRSGRWGTM